MSVNPQVLIQTHEHYVKDVMSDGVLESSVTFQELKNRSKLEYSIGGTQYGRGVMRRSQFNVEGWGSMTQQDLVQPDMHDNWSQPWGGIIASYIMDQNDILANSGKPEAIRNMQKEYAENIKEDIGEHYEDYCYLNGLALSPVQFGGSAAFIKQSGTYGGLSQATSWYNGAWAAQIVDGTAAIGAVTNFTTNPRPYLTALQRLCVRGKTRSAKNMPTGGFMDRTHYDHITNAIEEDRRVVSLGTKLKLGFDNFVWQGVPYYWSDSAPSGRVELWNHNHLRFAWQTATTTVPRSIEMVTPIGTVHQCYAKGQMACLGPRFFGAITPTGVS